MNKTARELSLAVILLNISITHVVACQIIQVAICNGALILFI